MKKWIIIVGILFFSAGFGVGLIVKYYGLIGPKNLMIRGGEEAGSFSTLPSAYADLERKGWQPGK